MDGVRYAQASVDFAALAIIASGMPSLMAEHHLYALAIELAFKSLALRLGATHDECRRASHSMTGMISLAERKGASVPEVLKTRLGHDKWFKTFLLRTRYPTLFPEEHTADDILAFHPNYPEMIAAILEIPCQVPLEFHNDRGALGEILDKARSRQQSDAMTKVEQRAAHVRGARGRIIIDSLNARRSPRVSTVVHRRKDMLTPSNV